MSILLEMDTVSKTISALKFFKNSISFKCYFLFSFQLLIERAIKIPITTSIISPIAYLKYFMGLLSSAIFLRVFLKIGIIFISVLLCRLTCLCMVSCVPKQLISANKNRIDTSEANCA